MFKAVQKAPFVRLVVFFIVGIIIQYHYDLYSAYPYTGLLAVALILFSFIPRVNIHYPSRFLFGMGISILCFSAGGLLTRQGWKTSEWNVGSGKHHYKVRILEDSVEKPKTRMYKAKILYADSSIYKDTRGKKIIIYIPKGEQSSTIKAGDCLIINARLNKPEANPESSFDYPLYLRKQSYAAIGFIGKTDWRFENMPLNWHEKVRYKALDVRRILLEQLRAAIPEEDNYSVAAALVFGYRAELSPEIKEKFSNSGAGHILAISGLHFNLMFGMLFFAFSFLGTSSKSRIIRLAISLPIIWLFAFMTGFSPSVCRAACMISIWIIGKSFFLRSFSLNSIAVAAFFMLLYNPLYLFNISFQLSFVAVASIVFLNPYLIKLLRPTNKILRYFWELVCVSTSAQIGVMPLVIFYFHHIPSLFLLTNILVIPIVSLLLFLIPLALILHIPLIESITNRALSLLIDSISTVYHIPHGNISGININSFQVVILYIILILFGLLFVKKKVVYLHLIGLVGIIYGLYYLC